MYDVCDTIQVWAPQDSEVFLPNPNLLFPNHDHELLLYLVRSVWKRRVDEKVRHLPRREGMIDRTLGFGDRIQAPPLTSWVALGKLLSLKGC